ncbi:MAG TPA: FxsA family protein [Deltaproteobacteria bacterium]|nr:FxsA family protein [Deltaproteobacteria bacterium]
MLFRLLLLFTVVPAVELFVLLQLGSWMGPTATFLLILITGLVGATLAKREGLGVLRELSAEMQGGLPSADRLTEGGLVLVGGLLLITPGVFTDLTGFALIFPLTRRWLAPRIRAWLASRVDLRVSGLQMDPGGFDPSGEELGGEVRRRDPSTVRPARPQPHPFANKFDDL